MDTANPQILYVEDDMLSRAVAEILFTQVLGFQHVTTFENSENFIDRLQKLESKPDVIFLDIQMRPHDGYELLEMLRKQPDYADATVVALTANVMAHDVEKLKQVGFNGLIGKPLMREIFPQLVQNIIAGQAVWYIP